MLKYLCKLFMRAIYIGLHKQKSCRSMCDPENEAGLNRMRMRLLGLDESHPCRRQKLIQREVKRNEEDI